MGTVAKDLTNLSEKDPNQGQMPSLMLLKMLRAFLGSAYRWEAWVINHGGTQVGRIYRHHCPEVSLTSSCWSLALLTDSSAMQWDQLRGKMTNTISLSKFLHLCDTPPPWPKRMLGGRGDWAQGSGGGEFPAELIRGLCIHNDFRFLGIQAGQKQGARLHTSA